MILEKTLRKAWNPGYLSGVALLLAAYMVTAKLGLLMDAVGGVATTVWPPAGIALAALTLFGYRLWPGIAAGAFLINVSAGVPALAAAGMALGNTLEALLGSYLLQRFTGGFGKSPDTIRKVIGLVVLAAGLSTTVSATLGVASGYLAGVIPAPSLGRAWQTWWLGDALGDLVVAPLLFAWLGAHRMRPSLRSLGEAALMAAALGGVSLIAFGGLLLSDQRTGFQPYVVFPFLIWAALRFPRHGTATAVFAVASIAVAMTVRGKGPFYAVSLNESLLLLQAFMAITAVTMLVLSADVMQRQRAENSLRGAQEDLERRVTERTSQLSQANRVLAEEIVERKQAEKMLRDLSTRLLRIQDEERQRVARELHDSTAQSLTALSLNLSVAARSKESMSPASRAALDESVSLAQLCSQEIRSMSYLLHPPLLKEVGLPAALKWCAAGFSQRSGISVDLDMPEDFGRLPLEVENALFRIVQECLNNVQRHSGSPTARIELQRRARWVGLKVLDDGRGMPEGILSDQSGVQSLGVGLLGMRERVRQLGGQIRIVPGAGATIQVDIPVAVEVS
ncbi:MAG TPA: MASE1 domain-containing protein [Candidatus Polarisedimenticolia bacterium]|nr:MASE1 domain-containing protein [Candidatus Polarisedimenticolia bacterium]